MLNDFGMQTTFCSVKSVNVCCCISNTGELPIMVMGKTIKTYQTLNLSILIKSFVVNLSLLSGDTAVVAQ